MGSPSDGWNSHPPARPLPPPHPPPTPDTHIHTHTYSHTHTPTYIHTYIHTHTHTQRHTHTHKSRRQTDRQTHRQTDRQTDTHTHRHNKVCWARKVIETTPATVCKHEHFHGIVRCCVSACSRSSATTMACHLRQCRVPMAQLDISPAFVEAAYVVA